MRAVLTVLLTVAAGTAAAGEEVDASVGFLPCIPVTTYWVGPPQSSGMPPGPGLAVVSVEVRPKDARVILDGRFVGRARYFDGTPGYLYLEPGNYRLELRMGGYETEVIGLEAECACRYTLRHRMARIKGVPKESTKAPPGKGRPIERVFSPMEKAEAAEVGAGTIGRGPDVSLRSDLGSKAQVGGESRLPQGSLRLAVRPETASVYLDGVFLATARELELTVEPLAVSSGTHRIEARASGYSTVVREINVEVNEVLEIEIDMVP